MKNITTTPPLMKKNKTVKKLYSLGEEIFNSVTHGVGSLFAIVAVVLLVVFSALYGNTWSVVSSAIYGAAMIILYTMSTLYHAITNTNVKKFFRICDHCSIFILIAGTYTPFTLVTMRSDPRYTTLAWAIFGIVWGAAILGIALNSISLEKFKVVSIVLYIVMGWVIIAAIRPLINTMHPTGVVLLFSGGISYTGGMIFYALGRKIKYMHSIWHLFVLGGTILHFIVIFGYIIT